MLTVAIIAQKGGAGKTTIALNLAVAATRAGLATAVLDIDQQASATRWDDARESAPPTVTVAQASRLPVLLAAEQRNGATLIVIDTGPSSDTAALVAARLAELTLIPCRPSALDVDAIGAKLQLGKLADKPTWILLNAVLPRSALADETATTLGKTGAAVVPFQLGQRVDFIHPLAGRAGRRRMGTARQGGRRGDHAMGLAMQDCWLETQAL